NYFMDLLKPSDNKLAMKLFGSRKGVLKERLRQQRSDAFFLFDIVVNFRTGVLRNDYIDEIILEPRLIAMHYIKTSFI
ncbi:unnamed protein product, partial [Rotaria sp. Silwood1]